MPRIGRTRLLLLPGKQNLPRLALFANIAGYEQKRCREPQGRCAGDERNPAEAQGGVLQPELFKLGPVHPVGQAQRACKVLMLDIFKKKPLERFIAEFPLEKRNKIKALAIGDFSARRSEGKCPASSSMGRSLPERTAMVMVFRRDRLHSSAQIMASPSSSQRGTRSLPEACPSSMWCVSCRNVLSRSAPRLAEAR